jgi:hypothetical protein
MIYQDILYCGCGGKPRTIKKLILRPKPVGGNNGTNGTKGKDKTT